MEIKRALHYHPQGKNVVNLIGKFGRGGGLMEINHLKKVWRGSLCGGGGWVVGPILGAMGLVRAPRNPAMGGWRF